MIIVLKADARPDSPEVRRLIALAEGYPQVRTEIHQIQGATRSLTEIYLLGTTGVIPTAPFEEFACVEKVVRITERFRAIGRHGGRARGRGLRVQRRPHQPGHASICFRACARSTRARTSRRCSPRSKECGIVTTRAGAYKPRTSPYDFQGHGAECLPFVFELAGKYGIRIIAMEITHESHIEEIRKALAESGDATGVMLQIGTRNAQNFELLKAVGQQTDLPVLVQARHGHHARRIPQRLRVRGVGRQPQDLLLPARHEDESRRPAPQPGRLRTRARAEAAHAAAGRASIRRTRSAAARWLPTGCSTSSTSPLRA